MKYHIKIGIISLVYFFIYTNASGMIYDTASVRVNFVRAESYLKKSDWQMALDYYTKVLNEDSLYTAAYLGRGICYGFLNKNEDELKDYNRAVDIDPKNKECYRLLGIYNRKIGDLYGSINAYTTGLKYYPKESYFYFWRAVIYSDLEEYTLSINDLDQCITLNRNKSDCYLLKARLLLKKNKTLEAIKVLDICIDKFPNEIDAYYLRGDLYKFDLKDYHKASEDLSFVIKKNKLGYELALLWQADNYLLFNRYKESISLSLLVLQKIPEAYDVYLILAYDNAALSNRQLAYDNLQLYEAHALKIDSVRYYTFKEFILTKFNDDEGLLKLYTQEIENHYKKPTVYFDRASVYNRLGKIEEAKSDYKLYVSLKDTPPWTQTFSEAMINFYDNRSDLAIKLLSKAIQQEGPVADILFLRGKIKYTHIKDFEGALKDFQRAMDLDSEIAVRNPDYYLFTAGITNNTQKSVLKSLDEIDKYIKLKTEDYQGYSMRGEYMGDVGDFKQALADFEHALSLMNERKIKFL